MCHNKALDEFHLKSNILFEIRGKSFEPPTEHGPLEPEHCSYIFDYTTVNSKLSPQHNNTPRKLLSLIAYFSLFVSQFMRKMQHESEREYAPSYVYKFQIELAL